MFRYVVKLKRKPFICRFAFLIFEFLYYSYNTLVLFVSLYCNLLPEIVAGKAARKPFTRQ